MEITPFVYRNAAGGEWPWYAVYVRPNREKVIADVLAEKGVEVFVPTYRSARRWSDRRMELDLPLFGGYVFVQLNIENRLPVLMTPGVIRFVGVGRVPVSMAGEEVEAVRKMVASGSAEPCRYLKAGQKVFLRHGPLAGVEGLLVRVKTGYRVVVSVDMLQRSVSAEVDVADIDMPVRALVG